MSQSTYRKFFPTSWQTGNTVSVSIAERGRFHPRSAFAETAHAGHSAIDIVNEGIVKAGASVKSMRLTEDKTSVVESHSKFVVRRLSLSIGLTTLVAAISLLLEDLLWNLTHISLLSKLRAMLDEDTVFIPLYHVTCYLPSQTHGRNNRLSRS